MINNLKSNNEILEEKVQKMELFLKEYNLNWNEGKSKNNDE